MWDFPIILTEGGLDMKRKRYTEEQIISILKEHEAGASVPDLSRRHGVAENTIYRWKSKFGGMEVSEAKRLRELEAENAKLKCLLVEAELDKAALKELWLRETGDGNAAAAGRESPQESPRQRTSCRPADGLQPVGRLVPAQRSG
jgi:putative transposase